MTLGNKCVGKNERYNSIRGRAVANVSEKLSTLDVGDKLRNMQKKLTDLVNQKFGEAMKTTCEKVEEIYAAVVAVKTSRETGNSSSSQKVNKGETNQNISQWLRIQGIPEDPSKSKGENLLPTYAEVNDILEAMESPRASSSTEDLESLTPNGRNHERYW